MEHSDSDYNRQDSQPNNNDDSNNEDFSDKRNAEGGQNYHQEETYHNKEQYSPDTHKTHEKVTSNNKEENSQFKTPATSATQKVDCGLTMETENGYNTASTSPNKGSIKKGHHVRRESDVKKNFLAINKSVKTRIELFSAFSEKKKTRQSNVVDKQPGTSNILISRQNSSLAKKQTHQRQSDWNQVNRHSSWLQQQKQYYRVISKLLNIRQSQTGQKNESKDFVVKHIEVSINTLMGRSVSQNSLGGTFSKDRREKWYHQTNSSSITNLRSYQSLDVPLGQEDKPFPTTKGNQALKRAMNQSQVFPKTNKYLNDDSVPDEFQQHRGREMPVHNINNSQVQGMRLRNLSSSIY